MEESANIKAIREDSRNVLYVLLKVLDYL